MKKKWALAILAVVALLIVSVGCEATEPLNGEQGEQGQQGIQGERGADGRGIASTFYNNFDGTLTIYFTDGTMFTTGDLRGENGIQGEKGERGEQGIQGIQGKQGEEGERGRSGYGSSGSVGATGAKGDKGDTGERGLSAPILRLVQKDADWDIVNSGTGGVLQYSPEGREFGYVFMGYGLTPSTGYSLIYYADFEDRMNQWGGNNPGALIASGMSDSIGNLCLVGSIDLGIDLPSPPDANISTYDYSGAPDYYANAHGAKIWLVPSSAYDAVNKKVISWTPSAFLFETDLINYERVE